MFQIRRRHRAWMYSEYAKSWGTIESTWRTHVPIFTATRRHLCVAEILGILTMYNQCKNNVIFTSIPMQIYIAFLILHWFYIFYPAFTLFLHYPYVFVLSFLNYSQCKFTKAFCKFYIVFTLTRLYNLQ